MRDNVKTDYKKYFFFSILFLIYLLLVEYNRGSNCQGEVERFVGRSIDREAPEEVTTERPSEAHSNPINRPKLYESLLTNGKWLTSINSTKLVNRQPLKYNWSFKHERDKVHKEINNITVSWQTDPPLEKINGPKCVENTKIIIFGDSRMRQITLGMQVIFNDTFKMLDRPSKEENANSKFFEDSGIEFYWSTTVNGIYSYFMNSVKERGFYERFIKLNAEADSPISGQSQQTFIILGSDFLHSYGKVKKIDDCKAD